MSLRPVLTLLIFAAFAVACQTSPPSATPASDESTNASADTDADPRRDAKQRSRRADGDQRGPLAYVAGEPVTHEDLFKPLLEAAGGEVLAELVLDRMIDQRMARRDMRISAELVEAEHRSVLESFSSDEDEAARLLRELRQRRGLGEQRFEAFLRRNAALRKLVSQRVEIEEDAVRHEYRLRHGERYRVRVLVVDSFERASRLREQALANPGAFSDLAAVHSTDISADRGGLLSPISPADTSYPESLREILPRLAERVQANETDEAARISEVIAAEGQFAVVKLEEKIEPDPVEFADVREGLEVNVRRRLERGHMRQLAREMLAETDITVLDPALGRSWRQQRGLLLTP